MERRVTPPNWSHVQGHRTQVVQSGEQAVPDGLILDGTPQLGDRTAWPFTYSHGIDFEPALDFDAAHGGFIA